MAVWSPQEPHKQRHRPSSGCLSVVDVTTVSGTLSDWPTFSADMQKLKRRSRRFGCVWLSLIALPHGAPPGYTAPNSIYQEVGVSSQSQAEQTPQHHCVGGHNTVPSQLPSSPTLPNRSPPLSSSKEQKSGGAGGTLPVSVHLFPLQGSNSKTIRGFNRPHRCLKRGRMLNQRNFPVGICQTSTPTVSSSPAKVPEIKPDMEGSWFELESPTRPALFPESCNTCY